MVCRHTNTAHQPCVVFSGLFPSLFVLLPEQLDSRDRFARPVLRPPAHSTYPVSGVAVTMGNMALSGVQALHTKRVAVYYNCVNIGHETRRGILQ